MGALLTVPGCYSGHQSSATAGAEGDGGDADDGDGSGDDGEPATLECDEIGAQSLRRVSSDQYRQILADLLPPQFGEAALAASTFPATLITSGFSTYAVANTVSSNESIAMEDNADAIAAVFLEGIDGYAPELVPCLSTGFSDSDIDGCIDGFVSEFGARAFRRPLTEGETQLITELYADITATDGAEAGLAAVLQFFLQAPPLLYVTERVGDGPDGFTLLAPNELAVRLSLLFSNSAPDAELLAAVEEGRLVSRDDVEREARRMLATPGAVRAFATFHHEWMHGFVLGDAVRIHDQWTDDSSAGLAAELRTLGQWIFEESDGSFHSLMSTTEFPVDDRLADIYGTGGERRGLLMTASVMASLAHESRTSLIERAAFIRANVLCSPSPPLPGDVDVDGTLEDNTDEPTARGRLQALMTTPACSGCHTSMNPLGFGLEAYDWVGAYRTTENGATIDTTAEINLGTLSGSFANAAELIDALAATDEARDCYATQWFRYTMGRPETLEDACVLGTIKESFAASDGDIRELLVAIAVSDAFMFRQTGASE